MIKHFQLLGLLSVWAFLFATTGYSQQDEPAPPPTAETEEAAAETAKRQEVEINEDNYRQFMELKDPLQQRTILPEDSYQSRSGLQKLDKLPEESQKHLRNQLREIIVQRKQWQPGDENGDYPYVPSEAATTDGALQTQEAEAWGELVEQYHARESDIYANAARTRAAAVAAGSFGGGNKDSAGGSEGQGAAGKQAGQQSSSDQKATEGGYSPNAANDPSADSTDGVSQNAMEFLMKSGNLGGNVADQAAGSPGGNTGQTGAQGQSAQAQSSQGQSGQQQASQDQVSQQTGAEQAQTSSSAVVPVPTEEPSTAGTSQNALEYLTGKEAQNEADPVDTLTIEDLVNAQGVSAQIGVGTSAGNASDTEEPDEDTPKKDGGG